MTDDKELRMAWQQCNEELKNLPTYNSNNKENKDSRNMTTKRAAAKEKKGARSKQTGAATTMNKQGAAPKGEEESQEQTNMCSNNNEQT